MTERIYVTAADRERLLACIEQTLRDAGAKEEAHVLELSRELERATVVDDPSSIPADVITMRSCVRLVDLDTHEALEWTLVYPSESSPEDQRISVLAPLGTAMLGYRVGDTIEWPVPRGIRRLRVESLVYQPEAAGDLDL
jgi:regulator of nucleoside diphosphate kinase